MIKLPDDMSALAALTQAICAVLGLVVGIFTLVYLIRYSNDTKELTRISREQFEFARRDSEESTRRTIAALAIAQKQADAAATTVDLNRRTLEASAAAYVSVFKAGFDGAGNILVGFISSGKSIATDIHAQVRIVNRRASDAVTLLDETHHVVIPTLYPSIQQNRAVPGYIDAQEALTHDVATLVRVDFSYNNGFGSRVTDSNCTIRFAQPANGSAIESSYPCAEISAFPKYKHLFSDLVAR